MGFLSGSGPGLMNNFIQPKLKRSMAISTAGYNKGIKDVQNAFNEAKGYQQPYYDFGTDSLSGFKTWLSDPNAVSSDPSYKFRFGQGQQALENSAAARVGLLSGNALRAITDYGQDSASQEYENQYQRWLQRLGIGQGAAANMSNLSTGRGQGLANLHVGQGVTGFNQFLGGLGAIQGAENSLNNIVQSWVPAQYGGGGGGGQQSNPMSSQWMGQNNWISQNGTQGYGSGGDWSQLAKAWGG